MNSRPVEAAGAVDAQNASTAPWKTAKSAVSHSYHRPFAVFSLDDDLSSHFSETSLL